MVRGEAIENASFQNQYFEWMAALIYDKRHMRRASWNKLFRTLFRTEFTCVLDLDENRAQDGLDLRYRFAYETGYSEDAVKHSMNSPCSMLEMMVALARRCEESIMDDPCYDDRTGKWFFEMIESLGLGSMSDDAFDREYVKTVISRFLRRAYSSDGRGGLFTVHTPEIDMRSTEIWYQMMRYLNEIL